MNRVKRALGLCAILLMLVPAAASAQVSFNYFGVHPIHPMAGSGFCYTEGPHGHPYDIDRNIAHLYRTFNGYYHFAGNVYHFGYQRPAYPYYGHHPLPAEMGGSYCYIDGGHYHHFVLPVTYASQVVVHNGYYYYNGPYSPVYYTYRPIYYVPYTTYQYLPAYQTYYSNYTTTYMTYARPASVSYFYRPSSVVTYTPTTYTPTAPAVTVYRTAPTYTPTRTYTTTYSRPVYRYTNYRTYNTYSRPSVVQTRTTYVTPSGTRTVTTTTRTWRR